MQVRAAWRASREPGETLVGWALLMPSGRTIVVGSAFVMGILVPVLLPLSVLVFAWAQGSGRRLGLLTDRRLILVQASRGHPRIEESIPVSRVLVRGGTEPEDPVRVCVGRADGTAGWFRPANNGLERRFVAGLRTLSRAEVPGAVC
jgi:hypothetical protein